MPATAELTPSVIEEFAAILAASMEDRPLPSAPIPIVILDVDEEEPEPVAVEAEGQYFVIEYRDSRGRITSRRINVWGIGEGVGGVPMLKAFCHERKAPRNFRVDRIITCIDLNGEVFDDVPAFMLSTFDMPLALSARRESTKDAVHWTRMRGAIRPYAVLFAALSHSDGLMSQEELFVATEHCAKVADDLGFPSGPSEMEKIEAYIRRQNPTSSTIWQACEKVFEDGNRATIGFLRAALDLVDADGERHPAEEKLLNDIAVEMTGAGIL